MSGFTNPIIGGGGALVYPSIHSPKYQAGTAGWDVGKDGSAEFNNVTIRGSFSGIDWEVNADGAFFYGGPPAKGNLILSIARAAGTDSYGNAYYDGLASYENDTAGSFGQQIGGLLIFGNATYPTIASGAAGINMQPDGSLLISVGLTGAALSLEPSNASSFGGPVSIASPSGTDENLLLITNQGPAGTTPLVLVVGAGVSDRSVATKVAGDSQYRWAVNTNGKHQWGSGSAALDTLLYRVGPAQLAVDELLANISGSAETWHSLTIAGFTGMLRYRKTIDNCVEIQCDGTFSATGNYQATVPAAYTPVNPLNWPAYGASRGVLDNTGTLKILGVTTAGATVGFCQRVPLD